MTDDYSIFREFGILHNHSTWYATFAMTWDTLGHAHAAAELTGNWPAIAQQLGEFTPSNLLALRHPNVPNVCATCGKFVEYNPDTKAWYQYCSAECRTSRSIFRMKQR